jgi:hypothetical protein
MGVVALLLVTRFLTNLFFVMRPAVLPARLVLAATPNLAALSEPVLKCWTLLRRERR